MTNPLILARTLAALSLWTLPTFAGEPPPNVVLIFSDDQGSVDLGCYGSPDIETPHLDELAASGLRFTQFYVAAPICSPSRAALLTGRYPQRAGVPGNVPPGGPGLPQEQVTLAEMLQGAGYATGLFGKWHLGGRQGLGPRDQGFQTFHGHMRGCIDNYSHFFYWNGPNVHDLWHDADEVWEDGTHFSHIIVREAKRFMDDHRDQPFFLYLPFNIPHYPLQATPRWREHYQDLESPRAEYAALVSTLDEAVGDVLGHLQALGLTERTLVIFLSDHGHSTEVRSMSGGGDAGPYRGAKFSLLEGGIRVPAIVSWPGVLPQGEVREQLGMSMDWLPTIAELAGIEDVPGGLDGRSLAAVLRSAAAPTPHEVVHWQLGDQWAVREGRWKLVVEGRDTDRSKLEGAERVLLSDLEADVTERVNLAHMQPEVVARLRALHEAWDASLGEGAPH